MKTLIKKTKLLLVTFIIILNLTKKSPLFLHIRSLKIISQQKHISFLNKHLHLTKLQVQFRTELQANEAN